MSDALLVPIAVEGLVVNTYVRTDPKSRFLRWHIDYSAMDQLLDPLPNPWQDIDKDPPAIGVHLRWNLPRAFKHGETNRTTQNVDFPNIPNRWLIVRLGAATPAGTVAPRPSRAWIVESDYLGDDGANSFAVKSGDSVVYKRIGKCYELSEAPHLFHSTAAPSFLTAVGAGDVSFTAYQPDMQNVLSFYDSMQDVASGTNVTYLVSGWFANLDDDPVKKNVSTIADLQAKLQALRWSAQLGSALPSRTVVHGMLYEVLWQTTSLPPRADYTAEKMSVAVGHTAIDALAALVANWSKPQDAPRIEQRLQAFQYDMFDVLDEHGVAALEVNLRRGWFSQTPGGTMWSLVPKPNDDPSAKTPVLNDAQKQWLATLNQRQQQRDDADRLLRGLQGEMYELWWKGSRIDKMSPSDIRTQKRSYGIDLRVLRDQITELCAPENPNGIVKRVKDQTAALAQFDDLPDPANKTAIENYEKQMPEPRAPFRLKAGTEPVFSAPVDPVLLVAGVTPPSGMIETDDVIPCRLTSQTVTGVTAGGTAFTASTDKIPKALPSLTLTNLPEDVRGAVSALIVEAFFVDPQDAPAIGWCGAGWNDSAALADAMRNGAQTASIPKPLAASFAFAKWRQAWSPLYLVWEVTWYAQIGAPTGPPSPDAQTTWRDEGMDTVALDMAAWSFNAADGVRSRGSEYFSWGSGGAPQAQLSYAGRSMLTPQATRLFLDRLKNYVKLHPDADLQNAIDKVGAQYFLSQSLTLNEKLAARRHQHSHTPPEIASLIGDQNKSVPDTGLGDRTPWVPDADFAASFFPVRGGYFTIERLLLIDAFGQAVDLLQANHNAGGTTQTFYPVRGQGFTPDASLQVERPRRFLKQAPRVVQPSRTRMRLIDASNDAWDVGLNASANPVCGWLVHNFLDRSLSFYSPDGLPIGDLVLTGTTSQPDVAWITPPVIRGVTAPPLNSHAQAFRDQLLARSDRGAAFLSLLAVIDQRVGTIDYGSDPGDPDLAVLVGRPLALIRSRVELQLFGLPGANTSWRTTPVKKSTAQASWEITARQTANLTSIPFSIRLGTEELKDDGVIGYFDAGEAIFNSVRAPKQATPYIKPIGGGNYVNLSFTGQTSRNLTLLVDPRANVHATTGILPTASLSIPAEFVDAPLKRLAFTFRTGPILSARDTVRIPPPAEHHGEWLWLRKTTTVASDPCDALSIVEATEQPKLTERPRALDGWLKFTPGSK